MLVPEQAGLGVLASVPVGKVPHPWPARPGVASRLQEGLQRRGLFLWAETDRGGAEPAQARGHLAGWEAPPQPGLSDQQDASLDTGC